MRPLVSLALALLVVVAPVTACDGGSVDGLVGDADVVADTSALEDTSEVLDATEDTGPDTAVAPDTTEGDVLDAGVDATTDAEVAEDVEDVEVVEVAEDTEAGADGDGEDTFAPLGVRLVWDLASAHAATADDKRFFDYPWPESARRDPDGTLDLRGFPNPEAATGCSVSASSPVVTLLLQAVALSDYRDYVIAAADRAIHGFGTNTPIYFRFDGALGDALPSPIDTLGATATVQLVDVDPASPSRGLRTPVVARVIDDSRYLPPHTLAFAPFPGFPLAPGTRYAAIVLRTLGDADGAPLETPPALDALLAAAPETSSQAALYASALAELAEAGVPAADIAAITVFTTDDPASPLAAAADAIEAIADPAPLAAIEVEAVSRDGDNGYWRVSGTINTLDWQRGTPPYLPGIHPNFPIDMDHLADLVQPGGFTVEFDPEDTAGALLDGPAPTATADPGSDDAVRTERIRFELALPLAALDVGGDATGLPLVLYGHGTGGSERSPLGPGKAASVLAPLGIATFSIPAVMHDARAHGDNLDPDLIADLEALSDLLGVDTVGPLLEVVVDGSFFFNPLAVEAGRGNVLQSGVDFLWFAHLFAHEGMAVPMPDDAGGGSVTVTFDGDHLAFMGHSQGGLTGPLTALSPYLSATMLSAPGGHLASSLLTKEKPAEPFAVKDLFAWVVCDPDALDTLHPFIAVLSTFFEAADGLNYARMLVAEPVAGARHLLVTEGIDDHYATPPANEALTTAARLRQAGPVLSPVVGQGILDAAYGGFTPATTALSGNVVDLDGAWTAGFKQYHGESGCADDHFVYLCVEEAKQDWAHFFATWLTPGPPEIPAAP